MTLYHLRCLCGLRVVHHFDASNQKMSCADARAMHKRAVVLQRSLPMWLRASYRARRRTA